jgi:hypothetical protein
MAKEGKWLFAHTEGLVIIIHLAQIQASFVLKLIPACQLKNQNCHWRTAGGLIYMYDCTEPGVLDKPYSAKPAQQSSHTGYIGGNTVPACVRLAGLYSYFAERAGFSD